MNNLRLIEIELFSYCNRKCSWCPNKKIDRFSKNNYLSIEILNGLLKELRDINYSGYISFSRYEEPMSHIEQLKSMANLIKLALPEAILVTNTNGDYLCEENLKNLRINELTIIDYDLKGTMHCKDKLLNANCVIDKIIPNKYIYAHYNNIKILYYLNWPMYNIPSDRGGFLSIYSFQERQKECLEPQYFIGINYDGTVSPCCNIRNDIENHKPYIIGDLNKQSLKKILSSEERKKFIDMCAAASFEADSPCYYCANGGGRYTRDNGGIDYE